VQREDGSAVRDDGGREGTVWEDGSREGTVRREKPGLVLLPKVCLRAAR
jgi:hypothetical protein